METLLESSMWLNGPEFLWQSEEQWPTMPADVNLQDLSGDPEVKAEVPVCNVTVPQLTWIERIAAKFSSWLKFVKCVTWIVRFLRVKSSSSTQQVSFVQDSRRAVVLIWKLVQRQVYSSEVKSLRKCSKTKSSSSICRLRPILQDGLLRVGGRLQQSTVPEEQKHPIILPAKSPIVKLMVRQIHERHGHCGQNHLMAELRKNYWIVQGNSVVRQVIRECVTCKALDCRPMSQLMADLPSDRITPNEPPFTFTGTDCFGPFLIKRGRSEVKRYGAIFTCLVSRAVHVEMLESMEACSFMNALRRFLARRGPVRRMWSDNGSNLTAVDRELRENLARLDADKINRKMESLGIEWVFNPPHASNFGGAWERLIRSIRRTMSAVCRLQASSDDCLNTLFCEVESIINGRPLTRVTNDPDCLEALSPSQLLTLKAPAGPVTTTDRMDLYVRQRWRQAQYLADVFWARWTKEYLPWLQERQKWTTLRKNLKVGDVVLSLDEKLARGSWPLARVLEVKKDRSGAVRSAKIKTENGVYDRPINKLCMLLEADIE